MILNVTEEQKRCIEAHGYMVIEFKKWYRDITGKIVDVWNAIMLYLQYVVDRVDKSTNAIKKIVYIANGFVSQKNFRVEQNKYHFVRKLIKKCIFDRSNNVIYYRCRDRL